MESKFKYIPLYFFSIAVANALIIFQFVNIASSKGIDNSLALKVYSLMQINIIISLFIKNMWLKNIDVNKYNNITFIIRIILLSLMFVTNSQTIFLLSMLCYGFVFSGFDVVMEGVISSECAGNDLDYGGYRKFYSIGFALN